MHSYTSFSHLEWELGEAINRLIRTRKLNHFDENSISFDIVGTLEDHLTGTVDGHVPATIASRAFKSAGPVERKYGDIALLIRIDTHTNLTVEGAAFLEAKKRPFESTTFPALKKKQLTTLHNNLWNSRLLFYDMQPILHVHPEFTFSPDPRSHDWRFNPYNPGNTTHALVVPTGLVVSLHPVDMSVYRFGTPLTHQLTRYLHGLDLEHDADIISSAKGDPQCKRSAEYVVSVTIGVGREPHHPAELLAQGGNTWEPLSKGRPLPSR